MGAFGAHVDDNQQFTIIGVVGTLGTADEQGTARALPFAVDPTTGAAYVNILAGSIDIGTIAEELTISAGTITLLPDLPGGTVDLVTRVANVGTLESGTFQFNPTPIITPLAFGTLGTAGGSFFGTLSAASGAGTKHYVYGVDIVMDSGTADVRVLAGTSIQGTGVLAAGKFTPGGGISKPALSKYPFVTGTNSELVYHFVGAGTAFITVNYWKGV